MSKRTKATDISIKVRQRVQERDLWCIFCGNSYGLQVAHYIPRSSGGLGIEENLALACFRCHHLLDQSIKRKEMLARFESYLRHHYPNWEEVELIYRK